MTPPKLATLNAVLNAISAILILLGYRYVRAGRTLAHRNAMLGAVATSALFLVSYGVYHFQVGSVRFGGVGPARAIYFAILASHTVLAAIVPILVALTVTRALRGRLAAHRKVAVWTLPIWLYVSVTGVTIYVLLYLVYGPAVRA
jgi:uncharacterized membrane protein YozB (DUF420 family)